MASSEAVQGLADDRRHDEGAASGDSQGADRLHGCAVGDPVHTLAAVFLGKAQPHEPVLCVEFVELPRVADLVSVHPAQVLRIDLVPDHLSRLALNRPRPLVQHEIVHLPVLPAVLAENDMFTA